jgi:integrase
MPTIKVIQKNVDRLKAPDPSGKQVLHWDSELKGFGVLCSGVSNSKSYVAQAGVKGLTRRIRIGKCNLISCEKAREKAKLELANLTLGIDPKASKGGSPTLAAILTDYLTARGSNLAPRTVETYNDLAKLHLDGWRKKPINQITAEMVENRHRAIADDVAKAGRSSGHNTANAVMKVVRLLWNHALEKQPALGPNPVRLRKRWFKVESRTGMVQSEQLPAFYQAIMKLPNPVHRDYLVLLLFTGLRRREAASLTWQDIDFVKREIRIPASVTKAKRKLDLPMTDIIHDMLVARRALGDATFVFPSNSKSGHLAEPKFALTLIAATTGIKISVHDLRRTFITTAESCNDISLLSLAALVNHSLGRSITAGYVVMAAERLREPAQKVANRIKELCGIKAVETTGNVQRLR